MSQSIDPGVDTALDNIVDVLAGTPADRRGAVIVEIAAAMVDCVMAQATDPHAAASMIERWVRAALAERIAAAAGPAPKVLH